MVHTKISSEASECVRNGKNSGTEGKQLEIRVKYKPFFYDNTADFLPAQQLYLHFHFSDEIQTKSMRIEKKADSSIEKSEQFFMWTFIHFMAVYRFI